jgi:hypothetical protein
MDATIHFLPAVAEASPRGRRMHVRRIADVFWNVLGHFPVLLPYFAHQSFPADWSADDSYDKG